MSSAQFPLGSSGNAFIHSDPPANILVKIDSESESKRPRSLSSPLKRPGIIAFSNESLAIIDSAVMPTFLFNETDSLSPQKPIKAHRRQSDKTHTDKKITHLKKEVTLEADKQHKHPPSINLKKEIKSDDIRSARRRDSRIGNESHSPRVDIYGVAKALFTQLENAPLGAFLLLKLGKKIDDCLPLIINKIDLVKQMSADLANEMKLFIHNVHSNSTYKQYKKAIKIVESGLEEVTTEDLFGRLQQNCTAYDYEVYTQIIFERALTELRLISLSIGSLKKSTFLGNLCGKLDGLDQDYFHKFSLGFQEIFKNFHEEAKIQLKLNPPQKHEQILMISDQRTNKNEMNSAFNLSTAAISYMMSICECEAMRVQQREASKLLNDLQYKAKPGNFLRMKLGKEIDKNREFFRKWTLEPFHPLPLNELNSMKIFYDSISKNEAYEMYVMHSNQKQKLVNERTVKEISTKLSTFKEEIKSAKKANKLCDKFNPNDVSKKEECLIKLFTNQGNLEIVMEALLEKAIKECEEISKVNLHDSERFSNFSHKIMYKIENFSKYLSRFSEGYVDLFNRFKQAITGLQNSPLAHKLLINSEEPTFSIKAINQLFKIFEENILQIQQKETSWVLKNLELLDSLVIELQNRKIKEDKHFIEKNKSSTELSSIGTKSLSLPEVDEKFLLLINKKLEKAKKFARLQQIRGDILNLIKDSQWAQHCLYKSNDPNLLNLRDNVLKYSNMSANDAPVITRSRARKRFNSREECSSLEKSSSPRLEKSISPSRPKKTLSRSASSASIEDSVISKVRTKTSISPDSYRPLGSISDSTTSDSQSPRSVEQSLTRAKSCKAHSSPRRKISSSPRIEDPKKLQEEVNDEFINLLVAPGVDNTLQRNLIASYATFFKPISDDPPLVEFLKCLHKKFLESGPYEKQEVMVVLRELLCSPVNALIHFSVLQPLILEIIKDAKSKSNVLQPYIEVVQKLISSFNSDRRKLGPPNFYSGKDYTAHFEVTDILPKSFIKLEHKKESSKNILDIVYDTNVNVYSQSLKRINLFDYIQIDSCELKNADFSINSPHISALGKRFTLLSNWVLESIFLKYEETDETCVCRMIEFFIDVTDSLMDDYSKNEYDDKLRKAVTPDYLSALAIFAVLQKPFVEKLFLRPLKKKKLEINKRHTNENAVRPLVNISERHLKKYLLFKETLAITKNFKELREKIKEDLHCIPPILITTHDITSAFEKNRPIIDNKINLRCVENLGNLLYNMATHQKHLIPIYLPFGKPSSLFDNTVINFDQLFQIMQANKKYQDALGLFDEDLLDTLCREKVKQIFPTSHQGNISPRKEETKIRFET